MRCPTCNEVMNHSFPLEQRCVCDGFFHPWEDDHVSLVHVLWDCHHDGLTLEGDFDAVADRIRQSKWFKAVLASERAKEVVT